MRKRNKKTTIISKMELSGLTEHILSGMGKRVKICEIAWFVFSRKGLILHQNNLEKASSDRSGM